MVTGISVHTSESSVGIYLVSQRMSSKETLHVQEISLEATREGKQAREVHARPAQERERDQGG